MSRRLRWLALSSFLCACGGDDGSPAASGTSNADGTDASGGSTSAAPTSSSGDDSMASTGGSEDDATSTLDDGSTSDATGADASSSGEASASGSSGQSDCMGQQCHVDQTCEPEGCTFACDGVQVPGDYATIQEASDALSAVGDPATICVAPGDYLDSLDLGHNLTLIGASPALVTLGDVFPRGTTTIRGVTLDRLMATTSQGANVRVEASVMNFAEAWPAASVGADDIALFIDGCIVHATANSHGIRGQVSDAAGSAGVTLTVQNSWIDGGGVGVAVGGEDEWINAVIRNNTITGNTTGVLLWNNVNPGFTPGTNLTATLVNNVIVGSATAIDFHDVTADTYANNALFDNDTNYAGMAVPSGVTVTDDPMLDDGSPPAPIPGSPLIDAGTDDEAPDSDFWGTPRVATDIGAVEAP